MNLIKLLEESKTFQRVKTFDDVHAIYQNMLDEESNTSLDVTIPDQESEVYPAELYTEFDNGSSPFWIGQYVEDMSDLRDFRLKAEDLLVKVINDRNGEA